MSTEEEKKVTASEKAVAIKSNIEISFVLSNARVPFEDEKAVQLCLMQAKDLGVDRIFFNGDMWDYFNRSQINKEPLRVLTESERKAISAEVRARVEKEEEERQEALNEEYGFKKDGETPVRLVTRMSDSQLAKLVKKETMERALRKEMEKLFKLFGKFREALPNAELMWIYGCDEHNLVTYMTRHYPGLLDEIAKSCKDLKIEQRYNGTNTNTYRHGQLEIGHWFRGGPQSKSTAVAHLLLDDVGVSLIQGHTNRGGWACCTVEGQKYVSAYENFSLCQRPTGRNWQLGYSVVYRTRGRQRFQVYQVPIADYGFFWGTKEYQLDPSKVGEWELAVSISDIHRPYEDETALSAALDLIAELQPATVIVNGDANDFADISRFAQSPHDELTDEDLKNLKDLVVKDKVLRFKTRLERELEKIYRLFERLRKIAPKAEIIWIFGNHEFRLQRYVEENAPVLAGLRMPGGNEDMTSLETLSGVKQFGVKIVNSKQIQSYMSFGSSLLIGHFYKVNKKSAYTVRALVMDKKKSVIQPHVHRVGAYYWTRHDGKMFVGIEQGCLCSLEPKYMQNPNWQHGFAVIHKKKNSDRFYAQPVHIVEGAFLFGGKRYGRASKAVPDPGAAAGVTDGNDDDNGNGADASKGAASADATPKDTSGAAKDTGDSKKPAS